MQINHLYKSSICKYYKRVCYNRNCNFAHKISEIQPARCRDTNCQNTQCNFWHDWEEIIPQIILWNSALHKGNMRQQFLPSIQEEAYLNGCEMEREIQRERQKYIDNAFNQIDIPSITKQKKKIYQEDIIIILDSPTSDDSTTFENSFEKLKI